MLEFDFTIAPFSLVTTKVVKFEGVADGVSHRLFSLCIYLYRYGHTSIAFGDIKIYVEKLSKKDQRIFMSIIHRFPEHGIKMSGMLEETAGWRDEFFLPKNTPDVSFCLLVSKMGHNITFSTIKTTIKGSSILMYTLR